MVKLKNLRVSKKLTQAQLAEKCGLSQAYINELENCKKSNPSMGVLLRLSRELDVAISTLVEDEQIERGMVQ